MHVKGTIKKIIEGLREQLQGGHPQSPKTEIPMNCSQPNGSIQKKQLVKATFSELLTQMEEELQALNQLIRS